MPRARKNSELPEQVRKSKKGPAKLEPLHPKPDLLDKSCNDLAKFPDENPYPELRIHRDGTVLYANKASEGLLKARNSGMGQPAPAQWRRLAEDVLTTGQVAREELKDNGRVFAFRVVPITGNDYVNFYGVDITEQKRAEESLRESEEKFRTLADHSFDSIVIHDGQRIIEVNETFSKLWEYSPKEAAGLQIDKFIAPECWETVKKNIQSGYDKPYETVAIRKDGTRFPIEVAGKSLIYKGKTMRIATARDITERKKMQEALRDSEGRFHSLFEQAADAIVVSDSRTGAIMEYNDKACGMLGYTREEFGKLSISDIEAIESSEEILAHTKKVVKQGSDTFETKQRKKNGTLCDILVSTTPITIGGKQYIQGIWQDITEQRIAQKRLLEYQKNLKRLAARLTLTEERERRRIARDLHDQVSQSLALAKIKLDTMLASEKASPLAETLKETNDTIEKAIQNTRSLTLDLSHPILYELGFEAAVAEWLQEQVQKKHCIITEFFDDGLPKPLDDDVRALLFRNVRELLINIIKHARADKVNVSVNKTGDSIKITVEDNGVGLNVEEITASRKGGFGLFSIRESISELGGSFEIESKPGAGCKVTMTSPLKGKRQTKE